ncbi:MAG: NAD+ synthase [Candidatus Neomarinimicrobiota bacterium]
MDLKIALAQSNFTLGDIKGNAEKIKRDIAEAEMKNADMIVFPELALCGYPPLDLLLEKEFIDTNEKMIREIALSIENIVAIVPYARRKNNNLWNAAAIIQNAKIHSHVHKNHLTSYDIFDEKKYFASSKDTRPTELSIKGKNYKLGIQIGEDLLNETHKNKIRQELIDQGADIILNLSAAPFKLGKNDDRIALVSEQVKEAKIPYLYCNLVGGQGDLIFDGNSFAIDAKGLLSSHCSAFQEDLAYCHFIDKVTQTHVKVPQIGPLESLRLALDLGIKDYFHKSGFKTAVIGLSGGIDSALVAVLAAEALGAENIYGIALPSQFSSNHSIEDAKKLAENLGMPFDLIKIKPMYDTFLKALSGQFAGSPFGLAEENLQARIRGSLLMSVANKKNSLLLTTGNKTEIALGYCTLYGDMCGALAPLADLNKLDVYALSRHLNEQYGYDVIPQNTIDKIPSAELADDQYDPFNYDVISPLVDQLLANDALEDIIAKTGDRELVLKTKRMIRLSEYKRWQAAPALRVNSKAFSRGPIMPLVNKFREQGPEIRDQKSEIRNE